jgi:hypothetical protein
MKAAQQVYSYLNYICFDFSLTRKKLGTLHNVEYEEKSIQLYHEANDVKKFLENE